ncbi:MAG: hypothetical protein JWM31_2090, partial [Solirubrobacterales bacterium]|nr:hypothetical protein [Solirubrobacterales bacterium]
ADGPVAVGAGAGAGTVFGAPPADVAAAGPGAVAAVVLDAFSLPQPLDEKAMQHRPAVRVRRPVPTTPGVGVPPNRRSEVIDS